MLRLPATTQTIVGDLMSQRPVATTIAMTKSCLPVGLSVLFWYITSIAMTASNKIVFDRLDFNYPVLVTFLHFALMSLVLKIGFSWFSFFPEIPSMDVVRYLKFIVPIALCCAGDIALTNMSYAMVSLSVITVLKSSLVVFTYIFAVIFGLERFSFRLLLVVLFIAASIAATVPGMEINNTLGILCLCLAIVGAAIRWVVVHHQLQKNNLTPLQLMLLTQPLASIFLGPFAVFVDVRALAREDDYGSITYAISLVLASVMIGFLLILAEYHLVNVTSSLSLTVAGVGKEVATISLSSIAFSEKLPWRTLVGIGCSIMGILMYSVIRMIENGKEKLHGGDRSVAVSPPTNEI
eukprot:GHVO01024098.1.p1 GENE.GHVO01024098.1~~GHVO01024098.1.p1  ORF type:complete len:351 (+),score=24.39 GHVO01024098.1:3-1055(+)